MDKIQIVLEKIQLYPPTKLATLFSKFTVIQQKDFADFFSRLDQPCHFVVDEGQSRDIGMSI